VISSVSSAWKTARIAFTSRSPADRSDVTGVATARRLLELLKLGYL
jgi:hypothetical protein